MNIVQYYMTKNPCYIKGQKIKPTGIVVHSTGANNAYLKRYVNPDDGKLGANQYNNHWNKADANKCVHAFIGKQADGTVAVYQTLPWNYRSWGVGAGKKGSYNDSHIQFEICEDGLSNVTYYKEAFRQAKELCAYLCKLYGISPDNIVGHYEAWAAGYGSNHADPKNWMAKFNDSMTQFRADVAEMLKNAPDDDSGMQNDEPAKEESAQPEPVVKEREVITMKTLRNGDRGMQVRVLQFVLNQHGYSAGTADGIFGKNTLAAVNQFQKANGLTVDAICGKNTWNKLLA